ncbi:MAG: hypothetical protein KDA58_15415, partial [Planctomycetaceae bacterium]|nr:hypothetical protein [Planctomycetaceae bacterium]
MKKTWKNWLAALTACAFATSPVWSQEPSNPPVDSSQPYVIEDDGEGAAVVGDAYSGSILDAPAYGTGYPPPGGAVDANMLFDGGRPIQSYNDPCVGFACTTPLDRILWRVGRTDFDVAGVPESYTTLNAFVPISIESGSSLWWVNPRVHLTDNSNVAGSVGLGRRVYVGEEDRVYGASFWWDFDNAHYGNYHQLGGSFESLGRYGSLRFNFALPIGDANTYVGTSNDIMNPVLSGTTIGYNSTRTVEHAYQRYDFEYSLPMPLLARYGVDLGVGGYYLNGADDARDGAGLSVRTQAQVTEDFWVNGLLTTDPVFGANYSMNMELTIPDGKPSQWFRRNSTCSNLTASVLRQYRIPVSVDSKTTVTPYTNFKTGGALNLAVINPNGGTTGSGQFASTADYMALSAADRANYGVVLVRQLTNGTAANVGTPITLLDGQQLYGDGSGALTFLSSEGEFLLPGQSTPVLLAGDSTVTLLPPGTALPAGATVQTFAAGADRTRALLSNLNDTTMPVVTLANGNRVSGLQID